MSGYQFTIIANWWRIAFVSPFTIYSPLCETIIKPPVAAYVSPVMLVSHCGEYMANGLTNAVRHEFVMMANDRQTFVAVRKHSRSFLWCFECYAGLTSGECMANGLTNAIRHQFAMIAK